MICGDFQFNGRSLSDFRMLICGADDTQTFPGLDIDKSDISSVRSMPNHYSSHYADVLTLPILIIKDDTFFISQDELILTGSEINEICSWLQSSKTPQELRMETEDDEETYYYGIFSDIQPYVIGQECYGLSLTFTCNAPYGFTRNFTSVCDVGKIGSYDMVFWNTSSELYEYTYPTITIYSSSTFTGSEKVTIANSNDEDNSVELSMPEGKDKLIIDCKKKQFSDGDGNLITLADVGLAVSESGYYSAISTEIYSLYWLRLAPGINNIEFSVTSSKIDKIEVSARFARKAGGF